MSAVSVHTSSLNRKVESGCMFKAATYINVLDSNNVIFSLVQTVIHDLKNLLFKVGSKKVACIT
jgi:hypothetical protein